jgi:hypothetical protein
LAANGIKFSERGEVTLTVGLESEDDATATIRFVITDFGIGIAPEEASELFTPFVQADVSTTRKYGGSGLGLAISKAACRNDGRKDRPRNRGCSTCFTAVFKKGQEPVLKSVVDPAFAGPSKPALKERVVAACCAHAARILVAEDNRVNQFVALAQLAKLGYKADAVANGAMQGDPERCIPVGMNDYLAKPMELGLLAKILEKSRPDTDSQGPVSTLAQAANYRVIETTHQFRMHLANSDLCDNSLQTNPTPVAGFWGAPSISLWPPASCLEDLGTSPVSDPIQEPVAARGKDQGESRAHDGGLIGGNSGRWRCAERN